MATVCPLITFRYIKNREDEFFLAFGVRVRVFQFHIILFTTFRQGIAFGVNLPKSRLRTIVIIVNPSNILFGVFVLDFLSRTTK